MNIPLYIQQRVSELTSICDQQIETGWLRVTVALGLVCGIIKSSPLGGITCE